MTIKEFTFYTNNIEEVGWITKHLKQLPKKTLRSLESIESAENIGIDSPISVKNLIRIYPINGEIKNFNEYKKIREYSYATEFTHKKITYTIFKQPPKWLKNPNF